MQTTFSKCSLLLAWCQTKYMSIQVFPFWNFYYQLSTPGINTPCLFPVKRPQKHSSSWIEIRINQREAKKCFVQTGEKKTKKNPKKLGFNQWKLKWKFSDTEMKKIFDENPVSFLRKIFKNHIINNDKYNFFARFSPGKYFDNNIKVLSSS